jgi:DNA end-binding protein Ku
MVDLAKQLIARQAGSYNPSDVEDRYETRMRAIIDAKLKGHGIKREEAPIASGGNVDDLMAALRKSLGQSEAVPPTEARRTSSKATKALLRHRSRQPRPASAPNWKRRSRRPPPQPIGVV